MNCRKANKKISALIDSLLDEKDRLALLEHIKVCPDCKKLYDETKKLTEKLRSLPEVPLPEGAESRIRFALKKEAEKPKKKRWVRFTVIAVPAAAAAFAVVLGISYLFSGGPVRSTNDMTAMEAAPAEAENDGAVQKSMFAENAGGLSGVEEPQMTEEVSMRMESDEEESLSIPMPAPDTSMNVVFEGESPEEMSQFVEELLGSLEYTQGQAVIFDAETQSIKITLPMERYEEFTDIVGNSQNLTLKADEEGVSGDNGRGGLLFEVNFLFQEKN